MKKKYILLIAELTMILAVFVVYFVFPGIAFKLLLKAERSSAGLKQYRFREHPQWFNGSHLNFMGSQ